VETPCVMDFCDAYSAEHGNQCLSAPREYILD
jgi:hypothetical protein